MTRAHHTEAVKPAGGYRWDVPPWERRHFREHQRLAGLGTAAMAALDALLDRCEPNTLTSHVGVRTLAADLGHKYPSALYRPLAAAEAAGLLVTYAGPSGSGAMRQLIDPADAPMAGCATCIELGRVMVEDLAAHGLADPTCESARATRAVSQHRRPVDNAPEDGPSPKSARATRAVSQQSARVARAKEEVEATHGVEVPLECGCAVAGGQPVSWCDDHDPDPPVGRQAGNERQRFEAELMATVGARILANQRAAAARRAARSR